jgi:hypothetical protein
MHEIGHVLGFDHDDAGLYAVMRDELKAGARYTASAPRIDFDARWTRASGASIAWDASGSSWASSAQSQRAGALGRPFADFRIGR